MIGFWLVNLFPPTHPAKFNIHTPTGVWHFSRSESFDNVLPKIEREGGVGKTYCMECDLPADGPRATVNEAAFHEALPICLAASFATGAAVTIRHSTPASDIRLLEVGAHFPRARGLSAMNPCVVTLAEFIEFVERFVDRFETLNPVEKLLLLVQFSIDAFSAWSLEDLYLSGSTLLQIIADTEVQSGRTVAASHAAARHARKPGFFDFLAGAADRVGIAALDHDVVKIRNSLIHEGTLKHSNMPTQAEAAVPIAMAMCWVDEYVYAILGLGRVPKRRYVPAEFAYSINSLSY